MSIILADDVFDAQAETKKERQVVISKAEVFKDIDLYTHKTIDGSALESHQVRNAISSDIMEDVDAAVLHRYVEFRNAQLRRRIRFALAENEQTAADDTLTPEDDYYVFNLSVGEKFNDSLMRPLAEYIHRFLVFGALYDWYSLYNLPQAKYYGSMLDGIEDEIDSMLRSPAIVKRPLQPFGPSQKFY